MFHSRHEARATSLCVRCLPSAFQVCDEAGFSGSGLALEAVARMG